MLRISTEKKLAPKRDTPARQTPAHSHTQASFETRMNRFSDLLQYFSPYDAIHFKLRAKNLI